MVEIVRLLREAEARGIEHRECIESRPGVAGVLNLCDIGKMRNFVEALGDVFSVCAQKRCYQKQRKDDNGSDASSRRALTDVVQFDAGHDRQSACGRLSNHYEARIGCLMT